MKKVLIAFLMIFSWSAFAENWVSLGEISFKCPENVDLDFRVASDNENYSSFSKQTKERGNNALTVRVLSFDEFVKYEKDCWHTIKIDKSYESYKQNIVKNKKWYEEGPAETCFQNVYERKEMLFAVSYDFQSLWYVSDVGGYSFAVFSDNKVYLFTLYFTKTTGNPDDKILKQLDKYVHRVYPGVKLGEMPGEQHDGWMFNEGIDAHNLYNDIREKKTGVKEVDIFQQQFETIINSID